QLLVEWNKTATDYPRTRSVHELFEEQAKAKPDAVAVVLGKNRLTYRELNVRANQLARYLRCNGVEPGMKVALFAERSLEMILGLLGILKAGAGYAALDLAAPKPRLSRMLE